MRAIFYPILRVFKFMMRMARSKWGRALLIMLGLIAVVAAIWFGLPLIGYEPLTSVRARIMVMVGILALIGVYYLIRWRIRRRKAAKLEDALLPEEVGDGKVLAENMRAALTKLKKSGGKNYLYDLPWYVISDHRVLARQPRCVMRGLSFRVWMRCRNRARALVGRAIATGGLPKKRC